MFVAGEGAGIQTEEFKEEKTCFPMFQNDSFVRLDQRLY